jgi:hypothetical protein
LSTVHPLPTSAVHIPFECVNSYVVRLSRANDFPRAVNVANLAGMKLNQLSYADEELERLHALGGLAAGTLRNVAPIELPSASYGRSFAVLGHTIKETMLDSVGYRKVCPECLIESAHHPFIWTLRFVQSCTKHRRKLVWHCQNKDCQTNGTPRRLGWQTHDVCSCYCGFDLRYAKSEPVSDDSLDGQSFLENWFLGKPRRRTPLLDSLSFQQAADVLNQWAMMPFKARQSMLPLTGDPGGEKRYGTEARPFIIPKTQPDDTLGLRISAALAMLTPVGSAVEERLMAAVEDRELWKGYRTTRIANGAQYFLSTTLSVIPSNCELAAICRRALEKAGPPRPGGRVPKLGAKARVTNSRNPVST